MAKIFRRYGFGTAVRSGNLRPVSISCVELLIFFFFPLVCGGRQEETSFLPRKTGKEQAERFFIHG